MWVLSVELYLSFYVAQGAVGIWVRGKRGEPVEEVRERIEARGQALRDGLGVEIGDATSWGSYARSSCAFATNERGNWAAMADWLHDKSVEYRRVFESASRSQPSKEASGK